MRCAFARSRLDALTEHAAEGVAPRRWNEKLADRSRSLYQTLGVGVGLLVLAAWLGLASAIAVGMLWLGQREQRGAWPVVRVYESLGRRSSGSVRVSAGLSRVVEVDLLEEPLPGSVVEPSADGSVALTMRAFDVRTLRFTLQPASS